MICAQVHTQCHKSCVRYTLGPRYLYFKRNAGKLGVRVIRKVRAIGRRIRYLHNRTSRYLDCLMKAIQIHLNENNFNRWWLYTEPGLVSYNHLPRNEQQYQVVQILDSAY
jgi:hypothetical protein